MGYRASEVRTVVKYIKLVPKSDSSLVYYNRFKETFGEDANMVAIGTKDAAIFQLKNFNEYRALINDIRDIKGLKEVVGLPNIELPQKTGFGSRSKITLSPLFPDTLTSQAQLDSIITLAYEQPFYEGSLYKQEDACVTTLMNFREQFADSTARFPIIKRIEDRIALFETNTGIEAHIAGIPYLRTVLAKEIQREMGIFLWVSLIVTALVLLFFFRSFSAVFVPMLVICFSVVWVLGSLVLLDYKISMLTALIPPIIVVIGIPNCVYLLNMYHQQFSRHGNKILALSSVIRKIGVVTLITNTTTAIGFLVIIFAKIQLLKEFGIIAGVNVLSTFIISMILMPTFLSYLPDPKPKHLKHLSFKGVGKVIDWLEHIVLNRRTVIYIITGSLIIVCIIGTLKVHALSFMLDDIPKEHKLKKDLSFFEENFGGIMPLEFQIETGQKKALRKQDVLEKMDAFQTFLEKQPEISECVSLVNLVKASRQAYYNGGESMYNIPTKSDRNAILKMMKNSSKNSNEYLQAFTDSTQSMFRISAKVADIGSIAMQDLIENRITPAADSIFDVKNSDIKYGITGTTLLFMKGNSYLVANLRQSLIVAIIAIAIIMGILFRNGRMIILSVATNLIPLLITGALMGYAGIPLKPSTALIFSIAFGIAVDDSIHYLAKFRQELFKNNFDVKTAVRISLRETGASMIYTSIILFFGFIIFAGSNFGGTVMLGILTSTTLLCAMITNLIVLPSLILTFDSGKRSLKFRPLIDTVNETVTAEE